MYDWCLLSANADIDDTACRVVMERFDLDSPRDAVNLALRRLAAEPHPTIIHRRDRAAAGGGGTVGRVLDRFGRVRHRRR